MKKLLLLSFALIVVQMTFGQLTGPKSIPGDYATIEAAIAALNTQGVGSGGVTFNVAAGHTETFTVPTAGLITTTTGSTANPIVFQKSGAGSNPIITAATPGTAAMDYIICFAGADYVTFDGINVQDNAANAAAPAWMEWAFAVLKASETNGSQNITIKNCAITLNPANTASYAVYSNNHTTANTTQLVVTDIAGTNSNNKFFGLTISNTYHGFYMYGRADATPYAFYDQNNEIGVGGPNNITGLGNTGGTTTSYGIYGYYQNGIKIANNSFTGNCSNTTGSMYIMYLLTANNANVDIYGNTISMTYNGTGSFYGIYNSGFGSSGTTNTVNYYNNSIINNSMPNLTSGSAYFVYISTGGVTANYYNNNVSGNTVGSASATATGTIYYTYFASSPTTPGTTNMYNNTVSNNSRIQSAVGSGTTYIFYNGGTGNVFNEYNNTVNNITTATSGTTYGIYNLFSGATKNVHHNTFTNIYNVRGTIYSLYNGNGTLAGYFYNNKIQNVNLVSATGTLYGIYQSSGVNQYHYNNYVSELYAPIATGNPAIYGMYLLGATTVGAFNNTIYLNASSTSATFGATGIWASVTPNVELRNNIVVNNSTPGATGRVVAYQRSASTPLTSYAATSNNNNFYAGAPDATRLIFYDGTNADLTLAAYKSRVSPRDASSVSEFTPFVNIAATPYDLHVQTAVPTQCESGGATVSAPVNVIDDYDANPRYPNAGYPDNGSSPASAPDIGADEFGGIMLDITPPNIAFTQLPNTSGTGARTLTASITDPSGVPTAGTGRPVLYWTINAGSYSPVTGTWVSGSTYTFTFGAGVVLNDVVSYYVVAQDNVAPTPNVGSNPSGGASGFTFNPPACSTPPTTPFSYIIVGTLAGTYSVGVGQTYATLTAAIADLNLKEVIAPVTFELWDANYSASETFPLIIYSYAGMDVSRPVTFKPKAGVTATVTGAPATGVLVLYGADYITLDGSNSGGNDRNLTFENTNNVANAYVIGIFHNGVKGAQNNTIKNCVVKAGGKVNNTWAIILNAAGGDFDNTVIQNNQLLNAMVGMQFVGLSSGITNNGLVTQNIFGSSDDALTIGNIGMNVSNVDGLMISNNTFMNFKTGTNPKGINIGTNTLNATITGNTITGIVYTGTGGYGGKGIDINTGLASSNMTISNNAISQIKGDGWSAFSSDAIVGIRILGATGGINIYHNSISLTGTLDRSGAASDVSAALYIVSTATGLDIRDNIFLNSLENTSGVATAYSIYSDAAAGAFTNINYNDYWVSGPEGVLAYLGAQRTTLAAWQGATGQDANSVNLDPLFVSATDLHPAAAGIDNQGFYLSSVTTDITGMARTNPPDIGAYEFGTNPAVATLAATGVDCGGGLLNGTINANGLSVNSFFDYGLTTSYGSSVAGTPATVTGTTTTPVSAAISMPPSTTYHYRARGVTSAGVTVYGADMMLTTTATGAPLATTLAATNIGANSATLNGTVNALCSSTTVTFEYGLTTTYGFTATAAQSPVTGGANTAVNANITGLTINTLYHFRVKAVSANGTTYGSDLTFTTGANPPVVTTLAATNIGNFTARLNGTVNANSQSTTVTFQYGLTTSYGTTVPGVPGTVTGNTPTAVYADISGLAYNTVYHFRCVGQSVAGTTYGGDMVFTTLCPLPEAAGAITGPTSVCQNTSGHVYTVPSITYATGYNWTLPTGGTITGGANTNSITVSYSNSAVSGDVSVYGTSVCGNGTPSNLAVTVNPLPVPTITGPSTTCITSTYTYSTEAGMTDYTWTVSAGGQIMTGAGTDVVTIKWNSAGAQFVTVTYTSASGCPATAPTTLNVTVGTLPTPTIAGSNNVCVNSGWHVYTTQSGFSNYVWTVTSGGAIVSGQGTYQIEVNWNGAGSQTVTVNYANTYGCSASTPGTFAVTVMPLPGPAGSITGTPELCAGTQQVGYSVAAIPEAVNYIWTLPAGATIVGGENTNNIQVDFATDAVSGNITVYGEGFCGNGAPSPAYQVTVNPIPPTPVASVDELFVLTSSAGAGNQWYFNGVMIDGANGQFYQAEEEGFYWTIVTLNGCVSEESNHVEVIFLGLGELSGSGISIYPVPNDGKFTATIIIPGEDTFSISVYNELGMKVHEMKDIRVNGKAQQDIDLNNPSKGIYTIVFQGNDQTVIRKVLVTK